MAIQILNDTPLALGFVAGRVKPPAFHLSVVVKGAFTFGAEGVAFAAERPLFGGDAYWDEDAPSSCRYASDLAPFKPKADVTVVGTCHAPGGRPAGAVRVALRVGSLRKVLQVSGDRRFVTLGPDRHEVGEPTPFRSMPLRYEGAYGGDGHAPNPLGKGFRKPDGAPWPLPNVELAGAGVRSPNDRPEPAGFGPLDPRWSTRAGKLGTYGRDWLTERWPDFPDDFDWAYFNAAPPDQQVPYLAGDEPFAFEGLHPELAKLEGRLPGVRPRCFVRRTGTSGEGAEEVVLHLDTAAFDADAGTLVLVWRGLVPVRARDYAEIEKALVVLEQMVDAPLPASSYLAPERWEPSAPTAAELGDAEDAAQRGSAPEMPAPARPLDEPDPEEIAALDAERAQLAAAGVDPAILERLQGVTKAAAFSAILMANLPTDGAPPDEEDAPGAPPSETPKARKKRELDAERADLAKAGADPALLTKLEKEKTRHGFVGVLLDGMPPAQSPEEEKERAALRAQVAQAARDEEVADLAEEAAPRAARGERLTRDEAQAMAARGESLAEANLAGLDLSGAMLRGVNLGRANLAGAKLVDADLTGADLTGATLRAAEAMRTTFTDAVLQGAQLQGATLTGAALGGATLAGADLTGANLDGANLDRADFVGAKLEGASLVEASLAEALLDGVDARGAVFRGARGKKASLRGAQLGGASFEGAALDGGLLIECDLSGASFDGASLREAHCEGAAGTEVSFRGADLTNLRAGGARFVGGRFGKVQAARSNWSKAELTGADFEGALLTGANFTEAGLATATFHRARLEEATLAKAQLGAAKLTQANLFRARLAGADLTAADCRSSNLFECDLFEAVTAQTRFERANLKRTRLADRSAES